MMKLNKNKRIGRVFSMLTLALLQMGILEL